MNYLETALQLTSNDRESAYGHPSVNIVRSAVDWTVHLRLQGKLAENKTVSPIDVCWMMVRFKSIRDMSNHKDDNYIDSAGYLRLVERLTENFSEIVKDSSIITRDEQINYFRNLSLEGMLSFVELVIKYMENKNG